MTDAHKQLQIADLELPAKRGRPKSGNALSNAEKQREYRNRRKAAGASVVTLDHEELSIICGVLRALTADEPWRLDMIKKGYGSQLEPLSQKISQMVTCATEKAWQSNNSPERKVRK